MNKSSLQLIIYLLLSLNIFGQNEITITINSTCFQTNDLIALNGSFGLYGDMKISKHPFWVKDTLIKTLDFKKEQTLSLEHMHYTLRFIPDDSTKQSHSINFHSQRKHLSLSCFFFNQTYPLGLSTMNNNDCIKIISRYAGPTNMSTPIPIYSLFIIKKRRDYFASFQQTSTNQQGLLFLNDHSPKYKGEKL